MRKMVVGILLFVMGLGSLTFANNDILTVGTNPEFQPFEYLEDGKIVGFDVDLIEAVAEIIGKKIEWRSMAFDGLLPALQSKRIDAIIAGMTVTEERQKFVNFSDPYFQTNQMIVINKSNPVVESFESLSGHSVGVVLGYTGDIAVSEIEGVRVTRYNGASEAIIALKAQKVDAVVMDSEPAKQYAKQNSDLDVISTDVAKEEYAIAIGKEDTALVEEINNALKIIKENGTYDELLEKYFSEN